MMRQPTTPNRGQMLSVHGTGELSVERLIRLHSTIPGWDSSSTYLTIRTRITVSRRSALARSASPFIRHEASGMPTGSTWPLSMDRAQLFGSSHCYPIVFLAWPTNATPPFVNPPRMVVGGAPLLERPRTAAPDQNRQRDFMTPFHDTTPDRPQPLV